LQANPRQKTVLANGITVLSEAISSVRSVSVGVWIKAGSRFENDEDKGLAHFLEHMLFKGTEKRSSLEIARSLESVGGNLNAFTSKDLTCFYAEALGEHLERALDVLSDILLHSMFDATEMEKERRVIMDEMQSTLDIPEDLVQEKLSEKLFANSPLGLPILGTYQSVREITREKLLEFHKKRYVAGNCVIAAAGALQHQRLIKLVQKYFKLPAEEADFPLQTPQSYGSGLFRIEDSINQAHICVGFPALSFQDERRYALLALNTLLGGGMSSRLFQNIREKFGVAYSIYSFLDFYYDTGLLGVYLGTDMENYQRAIKLVEEEFEKVRNLSLSYEELEDAKAQLRGGLILSLEHSVRRMTRLAKSEIYLGEYPELDEVIRKIENITLRDVAELANSILNPNRAMW